jgi:hypothetical protein
MASGGITQKPQLACELCNGHAICTIPGLLVFFNLLILKSLLLVFELAQRLQLSSNPAQ